MANDIALNRKDHDIQFGSKIDASSGEQIATLFFVSGADRVAQSIKIRLKTFLGEWFLDEAYGVPYLESVLVKNPKASIINAVFRTAILAIEGVERIVYLDLDLDRRERTLVVKYEVESLYGPIKDSSKLNLEREK